MPVGVMRAALLSRPRASGDSAVTALFAAGEQGQWLDPSDTSALFQDTAGTTPAAVNSPVGRANDKSGRGNHFSQATSSARPMLRSDSIGQYFEFDGIDDYLSRVGANIFSGGAGTVIMAVRGAAQNDKRIFSERSSASATPFYALATGSSSTSTLYPYYRNDAAGVALQESSTSKLTSFLDSTNKLITFDDSGSVVRVRANGGAWFSQAYARGATTLDRTTLGAALGPTATSFFAGRCYGLISVSRQMTAAELSAAERFLAGKSGVTL